MMHAIPKAVIVQEYTPNSLYVKYLANVKVKTNLNMNDMPRTKELVDNNFKIPISND